MQPIAYEAHCMRCHRLEFDERFPRQVVPHEAPPVVQAFLISTYTPYCLSRLLGPAETLEDEGGEPARRRPGQGERVREDARSFKQCLDEAVQTAEQGLFRQQEHLDTAKRQGCGLCHILHPPAPGAPLPTVAAPAIPPRWLTHSAFAHQVHARAGRACEDCHRQARASEQRDDVLLPGIAVCQQCHAASGTASTACVSCHLYHDRTELARRLPWYMEGRFSSRTMPPSNMPSAPEPPAGR
jgi:hypothetical protein